MAEDFLDAIPADRRKCDRPWSPVDMREPLAGFTNHRRVDNRHHLVDVIVQETEEQRLVFGPADSSDRCTARVASSFAGTPRRCDRAAARRC